MKKPNILEPIKTGHKNPEKAYKAQLNFGRVSWKDKDYRPEVYGSTRKGCINNQREFINNYVEEEMKSKHMTLSELADKWLKTNYKNVSDQTYINDYRLFKNHIRPKLGHLMLSELNRVIIQNFIDGIENKAPTTVKAILNCLATCLNYAITGLDILPKNPCKGVKHPKLIDKNKPVFTEIEIKKLSYYCSLKPDLYIFLVSLYTGLRPSELLGIHWGDIDFDNNRINLSGTVGPKIIDLKTMKKIDVYREGQFKTPKSKRSPIVEDKILNLISKLPRRKDNEPVFLTKKGKPYNYSRLMTQYENALKELGIPYKIPYTTRYSFATLLAKKGVPVRDISDLLGHEKIDMSLVNYVQGASDTKVKAIKDFTDDYFI